MNELAMKLKSVRPSTMSIEGVIKLPSHQSHCQSTVVVVNVIMKGLFIIILRSQVFIQLRRWRLKRGKENPATVTECAKLGMAKGRLG